MLVLSLVMVQKLLADATVSALTHAELAAAMSAGGVVTFSTSGTLGLTNTIEVRTNVTLLGNGNTVIISGEGAVRLFRVVTNTTFAADGLILANGTVLGAKGETNHPPGVGEMAQGGGILNEGGRVTLANCVLTNHLVRGGDAGVDSAGQMGGIGGAAAGAAIWSRGGELTLTNCALSSNRAEGGLGSYVEFGRGNASGHASGGAIHIEGSSASLHGVRLAGNSAMGGAPESKGGFIGNAGKGGDSYGGCIFVSNAVLTVYRTEFSGNSASPAPQPRVVSHGDGAGNAFGGALYVASNAVVEVQFSIFSNNAAVGPFGMRNEPAGIGLGGAAFSAGSLTVAHSAFFTNRAEGGNSRYPGTAQGGAILSRSVLSIVGSTFSFNNALAGNFALETNVAGEGGAVWSSGQLAVTNSTFAMNKAVGGMASPAPYNPNVIGGPARGGGIAVTEGRAVLVNVTAFENSAEPAITGDGIPPVPSQGGALFSSNAHVVVRNSILANSPRGGDVWGQVVDSGYNLASDSTAGFVGEGSLNDTDPLLSALSSNGGETPTFALLLGSPARDAIPSGFPETDQRGIPRPQGPAADIGAYEAEFVSSLPAIFQQPLSQTVRAGSDVMFSVVAGGTGPLSYYWLKDGTNIVAATASTLWITNVQAVHAGAYSVIVSNAVGSSESQTAILVVRSEPLIAAHPVPAEVSPGASVLFSVTAEGPELSYRWFHNGAPVDGATNATLAISAAKARDRGTYSVSITNFAGSTNSRPAELSFDASALAIVTPPSGRVVEAGYPATMDVVASGVPPFMYQWTFNGVSIPGATNSSYVISQVSPNDAGAYSVTVANAYKQVSSTQAFLIVKSGALPPSLGIRQAGASIAITFDAQAGRSYRLLTSANLTEWSTAETNSAVTAGKMQFIQPVGTNASAFFRVVTP